MNLRRLPSPKKVGNKLSISLLNLIFYFTVYVSMNNSKEHETCISIAILVSKVLSYRQWQCRMHFEGVSVVNYAAIQEVEVKCT